MENPLEKKLGPVFTAVLAAALYGVSAPFSKMLLHEISPLMMAALLYLGAGIGMLIVKAVTKALGKKTQEAPLSKKDLPYVLLMVFFDIAAPILLMFGLNLSSAGSTALLNNFEIVATSFIALAIFKEAVGKRMWFAIILITAASILLSFEDIQSFSFSIGSVLVLLACLCWGFENNFTRNLSEKDPIQIVIIKGLGSGGGALIIAFIYNSASFDLFFTFAALLLGFLAFGMSIFLYIKAQRHLGAARTSAYYAATPFIGVLFSWFILKESFSYIFFIALGIMILGTYLAVSEKHKHTHIHESITHSHKHSHGDMHHTHTHFSEGESEHSHEHTHEKIEHSHSHTPDIHHRHEH